MWSLKGFGLSYFNKQAFVVWLSKGLLHLIIN